MPVSAKRTWADHPMIGRGGVWAGGMRGLLAAFTDFRHPIPHRPRFRLRRPGAYVVPSRVYHADPAPLPSLSHSIARLLLTKAPRHARYAHPLLTPCPPPPDEPTAAMNDGTILHKLILGAGEQFTVIKADSWRTKAARAAAEEAWSRGSVPVLAERFETLERCAAAVIEQMRDDPDCAAFFEPGRSEVTLLWKEAGFWCRALVDRLPDRPGAPMFDLKSTGMSAAPDEFQRRVEKEYATQAVHYLRGGRAVLPVAPSEFRFIAFETAEPHCMSTFACGPTLLEAAETDIRKALTSWARCTILNSWPGYPKGINYVEASVTRLIKAEESKLQWSAAA